MPLTPCERRLLVNRYNDLSHPLTSPLLIVSFFRSLGEEIAVSDMMGHLAAVGFVHGLGGSQCAISYAQLEALAEFLKRARHEASEKEKILADRLDALELFTSLGGSPDGSGTVSAIALSQTLSLFDLKSEVSISRPSRSASSNDAMEGDGDAAGGLCFREFLVAFDALTTDPSAPSAATAAAVSTATATPIHFHASSMHNIGGAVPQATPTALSDLKPGFQVAAAPSSAARSRPSTARPQRSVDVLMSGTEKALVDQRHVFLTNTHETPLLSLRPRSAGFARPVGSAARNVRRPNISRA